MCSPSGSESEICAPKKCLSLSRLSGSLSAEDAELHNTRCLKCPKKSMPPALLIRSRERCDMHPLARSHSLSILHGSLHQFGERHSGISRKKSNMAPTTMGSRPAEKARLASLKFCRTKVQVLAKLAWLAFQESEEFARL